MVVIPMLQGNDLVMLALGIDRDAPPLPEQPQLVDGVHLRWAFRRERGFPWHGYFLYRRTSEKTAPHCLASEWQAAGGSSDATTVDIANATLSSDTPLTFTNDFDPHDASEVDLRGRGWVRVDLPLGEAACQIALTIGFRRAAPNQRCVNFAEQAPGALKNPFALEGAHFDVRGPDGASAPGARIIKLRKAGLDLSRTLEVALPEPAVAAELLFATTDHVTMAEALDAHGAVIDVARGKPDASGVVKLNLTAARPFARLRVASTPGAAVLERLCWFVAKAGETRVDVHAFDGLDEIQRLTLAGAVGATASTTLRADRITAVRIDGTDAALVELCWTPVTGDALRGWRPAPDVAQPIVLPVQHPDYPARAGPIDLAGSEQLGLGRVRYGPAGAWAGRNFADLHDQLVALVDGGPAKPMADPTRAARNIAAAGPPSTPGVAEPRLELLHPLDVALLVSMYAPLAQILGVSLPDTSAQPGVDYDYMIVADQTGVGGGKPQQMLQYLAASGFVGVDAWICFNVQRSAAAPLDAPSVPAAYALPGGTFRAGGVAASAPGVAAGAVGLDWDVSRTVTGRLAVGKPALYHVWRADEGNGAAPVAATLAWLTQQAPLLVTSPASAPLTPPSYPSDWPQRSLRLIDPALDEGWYGYRLSAIDLFGRFSGLSPFAAWRQWAPRPDPAPWYYVDPAADRVVNPAAVRILDKTRPPPPAAVEAWALDPVDPLVVADAAYVAWRRALPPAVRDTLVGLRVRWRWLTLQQRQAPDVGEFRVYYNPSATPPPGWPDVDVWRQRCFVSPYNANVTVAASGDRTYGFSCRSAEVVCSPMARRSADAGRSRCICADFGDRCGLHGPLHRSLARHRTLGRTCCNESPAAPPRQVFRVSGVESTRPSRSLTRRARTRPRPTAWTFLPHLPLAAKRRPERACPAGDGRSGLRGGLETAAPRGDPPSQGEVFPDPLVELDWTAQYKRAGGGRRAQCAQRGAEDRQRPRRGAGRCTRALEDDALRILAGLAGNEKAFTQATLEALDGADPRWSDRRGPDDDADYAPRAGVRAWQNTLDGRSTNRYLYRAVAVDAAQIEVPPDRAARRSVCRTSCRRARRSSPGARRRTEDHADLGVEPRERSRGVSCVPRGVEGQGRRSAPDAAGRRRGGRCRSRPRGRGRCRGPTRPCVAGAISSTALSPSIA